MWSLEPGGWTRAACKVSFRRLWPEGESYLFLIMWLFVTLLGSGCLPGMSSLGCAFVGGLSALVVVNFLPSRLELPDCQTIFFSFVICCFRFSTLLRPFIEMHGGRQISGCCGAAFKSTWVSKAALKTKWPHTKAKRQVRKRTVRDFHTSLDLVLCF